jgi:hypothetical protein
VEDFNGLSLSERKKKMMEDCCGGAMSAGADGYEASSNSEGPTAGYDPLLRTLKMLKRKKKSRG